MNGWSSSFGVYDGNTLVTVRHTRGCTGARVPLWLRAVISVSLMMSLGAVLTVSAAERPDSDQGARFNIFEFRVLGNSTLPAPIVEAAVYPFLGEQRTFSSVEQARDALVAAYRAAGLGTVLVDIPEQTVDDGVVRLQVTEGRI